MKFEGVRESAAAERKNRGQPGRILLREWRSSSRESSWFDFVFADCRENHSTVIGTSLALVIESEKKSQEKRDISNADQRKQDCHSKSSFIA
jgi:hypothetical protein